MTQHQTRTATEPDSKQRLRLWLRLLKSTRGIEANLRENLRSQFATTLPRFDVLAALSRYGDGLKMSELSGVLRVSNGNVTGIVDRLADEGLLIRVPVPGDRRASVVRLTQRGQEEFQRQADAHEAWINDMLAPLDGDDASDIAARLETLEASLNQKDKTR